MSDKLIADYKLAVTRWAQAMSPQTRKEHERAVDEAEKRIASELERLSAQDDPEFDATDGAHPAWWRGHDHTSNVFCALVTKILDGKDDGGGFNHEPWHTLRRRLIDRLSAQGGGDVYRDALAKAYEQGCHDVHNNYREDRNPEFSEAAYDYADSVLSVAPPPAAPAASVRNSSVEPSRVSSEASVHPQPLAWRERVQRQADGLKAWLSENAPYCDVDQNHLDGGSVEQTYWNYGRYIALRDVLRAAGGSEP